ncbi:MAG: hypothetical protein II328_02185, partial [Clostridia bacterium]|nr:hypothetical protein [Clostridia bacterium]
MKYVSTRLGAPEVSAPQAILKGLAPDGGLYVPTEIPKLDLDLLTADISYEELATRILLPFLPEYKDVLADLTHAAYGTGRFDTTPPTPLKALSDGVYSEELWHGPTSAFKDMALQLMPRLLSAALRLTGEKRDACILTATSGDTGKAALEGFCRDIREVAAPGCMMLNYSNPNAMVTWYCNKYGGVPTVGLC